MASEKRVRTFDELLADYSRERSRPGCEPIRLGFGSLDADLRGVSPGQMLGIAARTAVGKTWALNTVTHNVAAGPDTGVLVLSLEMPSAEWAERQLAIEQDVAPEQVEAWARDGELGRHAASFLERMANTVVCEDALRLCELPSVFADTRSELRVPLRLVVIDYLGMLSADGRDAYERASALGRGLKQLAKAEQVAIWFPDASREQIERVLRIGYTSADPETRSLAYDTVNLLLRKGYRYFAVVVDEPGVAGPTS